MCHHTAVVVISSTCAMWLNLTAVRGNRGWLWVLWEVNKSSSNRRLLAYTIQSARSYLLVYRCRSLLCEAWTETFLRRWLKEFIVKAQTDSLDLLRRESWDRRCLGGRRQDQTSIDEKPCEKGKGSTSDRECEIVGSRRQLLHPPHESPMASYFFSSLHTIIPFLAPYPSRIPHC
ncbi:hypothetical protein FPV67DRAFT_749407 [Lyophyllum atratum]|nr:hypothetical protein FPV67DRAFT_749407 [Lyophyllum atratum]